MSRSGSPTSERTFASTDSGEKSGSPSAMLYPQPAIQVSHGRMARSSPIPISPKLTLGVMIQCRMLGRCST